MPLSPPASMGLFFKHGDYDTVMGEAATKQLIACVRSWALRQVGQQV